MNLCPTEDIEQITVADWLRAKGRIGGPPAPLSCTVARVVGRPYSDNKNLLHARSQTDLPSGNESPF